jgi:hypothetical protein
MVELHGFGSPEMVTLPEPETADKEMKTTPSYRHRRVASYHG